MSAPVIVAAGSLTRAMDEILLAYLAASVADLSADALPDASTKQSPGVVHFAAYYAPSGTLRREIEAGRRVDLFASASIDHVAALHAQKLLGAPQVFAHNALCILAQPGLQLDAHNLLEVLSAPSVRLASSTPVSDPMGDYTWQFFRNADKQRPGSYQTLANKALKLSGAAPVAVGAKTPYLLAFEDDKADAYVMYCTNAMATQALLPHLAITRIPDDLNVRCAYGIAAHPDSAAGQRLMRFALGPTGQNILRRHGFL